MTASTKQEVRRAVAARRRARACAERERAADAFATALLALPELAAAGTVAAYASYPSEPGTGPLRAALRERRIRVLLPVLCDDLDLDWVEDRVDDRDPGASGLADEDAGPRLGRTAIGAADLVVCPATAVDLRGTRLGRGGGSYDRALTRRREGVLAVALLHDDEILEAVLPRARHDQPVDAAMTPARTLRFAPDGGGTPTTPRG